MPEVLASDWSEYELLDSGNRRKLERFGPHVLIRSEPKAWWRPAQGEAAWAKAAAEFDDDSGRWRFSGKISRSWKMSFEEVSLRVRLTDMSKHVGVFPEQEPHWSWLMGRVRSASGREPRVLNLFGYTGAATLAASAAGAHVTHVDASKPAVAWARDNQKLSSMEDRPIRWILDDARKYVQREVRRKSLYDGILLDPPSFGRGPKGEVWKVEDQIVEMLELCRQAMTDQPLFLILTMYNLEASPLMLENLLDDVFGGRTEVGELALAQSNSRRHLPLSIFARWQP